MRAYKVSAIYAKDAYIKDHTAYFVNIDDATHYIKYLAEEDAPFESSVVDIEEMNFKNENLYSYIQ